MANVFQPVTQSLFGPIGSYDVREALRDAANREFFANLRAGRASPLAPPLVPIAPIPENVQRFTRKKRPDDYWTDSDLIVDPPITETDPVTQDTFGKGGFAGWGWQPGVGSPRFSPDYKGAEDLYRNAYLGTPTTSDIITKLDNEFKDAKEGMGLTYSGDAGPFTNLQLSRSGMGFGSGGPVINVDQLPDPMALITDEVDKKETETENVQPPNQSPPVNQRGFFSTLGGMLPSMGDIGGALSRFGKTTPVGTAFTLSQDPDVPLDAKIAAGATAIAPTILGGMATPVTILGSILNSMGWYTDPNEVIPGTLSVSKAGTLSGDSNQPGGGFYQTGAKSNFNFFNELAQIRPDERIDYKGKDVSAQEARNLSGFDHVFGDEFVSDLGDEFDPSDFAGEDDDWGGWDWSDDDWTL